jgi:RNA polymerase sigma factor (sigma-70 family)
VGEKAWLELQDEIALKLWENDESALTLILRHLAPAIENCLDRKYRGVLTHEDCEDIVAFAVKALWDYRTSYDDSKGKISTLLYSFADRRAKDVLAFGWQKARQLELGDGSEILTIREAPKAPSMADAPPTKGIVDDLLKVVDSLPDDQRRILVAKALAPDGEVTSGLLAEELGMPEGTVRVYYMRAKQTVKQEMTRRGHNLP